MFNVYLEVFFNFMRFSAVTALEVINLALLRKLCVESCTALNLLHVQHLLMCLSHASRASEVDFARF